LKERKEHPHLGPLPSRERRLGIRERRLGIRELCEEIWRERFTLTLVLSHQGRGD